MTRRVCVREKREKDRWQALRTGGGKKEAGGRGQGRRGSNNPAQRRKDPPGSRRHRPNTEPRCLPRGKRSTICGGFGKPDYEPIAPSPSDAAHPPTLIKLSAGPWILLASLRVAPASE